jgi:hypothetical protein
MKTYIDILLEDTGLNEAPLADFQAFGDLSKEGTLRDDDLKAIQNPKWLTKLTSFMSRTTHPMNIYVHNGDGDGTIFFPYAQHTDLGANRKVRNIASQLDIYAGSYTPELFQKTFNFLPPNFENSISVMLVENEGDERVPLTQWVVGHRIVHAIFYAGRSTTQYRSLTRPFITDSVSIVHSSLLDLHHMVSNTARRVLGRRYEGKRLDFVNDFNFVTSLFGKTKSMREKNLANPGEFVIEAVTQYLVQGSFTVNYPDMGEDTAILKEAMERQVQRINKRIGNLFDACVGQILVF